ncbi:MAG: hypothetical protein WB239_09420, partial [Acidimicrobiia bacterium]
MAADSRGGIVTEALLMAAVAACGFLLVSPLSGLPAGLRAALAFPVGLTSWLVVGLAMVVAPTSYGPLSSLGVLALFSIVSASVAAARSGIRVAGRALPWLLGLATITGLLSLAFQALDATAITPDSIRYLLGARVLATTGDTALIPTWDLLRRGIVIPLLHAPAVLGKSQLMESVSPLLAVGGVSAFVELLNQALIHLGSSRGWRWWLLVSSVVAFLGSNRGIYHAFYVNGHLLFAVCLLLLVMGYWMTARTGSIQWLLPALPGVAVMATVRPEGVLVVAPFLVVAMALPALPPLAKWLPVLPYTAATVAWFGLFLIRVRHTPLNLGEPEPALVAVALVVALLAILAVARPQSRLVRIAPYLIVVGPLTVLLAWTVLDPGVFVASLSATARNIVYSGAWGVTWLVILPAMVWVTLRARLPQRQLWTIPLASFAILFFLLPYLREGPYRAGRGDSGSRILMHV